ncbi:hypothetical protein [Micromonospora sp. WMMD736]|uniref:hypothetical protein n=1 Tax=Micromonospora sp. WMMD736 TaxID=3404112 RepID=UPI003B931318
MTFQHIGLPMACANLACPNKPGEGHFVLIETRESVVGGHRPIRLYICAPCAAGLLAALTKEVTA